MTHNSDNYPFDNDNIDPFDFDDFEPFEKYDENNTAPKADLFDGQDAPYMDQIPDHIDTASEASFFDQPTPAYQENAQPEMDEQKPKLSLAQMAQLAAKHQPTKSLLINQDSDYLQGLNAPQREAVETMDGPLLVLAGAGTGKTRVLTTRITHILANQKAWPSQMLVVTFTNKAAREMKERIALQIGEHINSMQWLGTFHAITAKILRRHAELIGLRNDFTILDPDDQIRMMKQIIRAQNIDEKKWPARGLLNVIDGWKNRGLQPHQVPQNEAFDFADGKAIELYKQYQERLKISNAADFGDMLIECLRLFQEHADILKIYQDRFKYILIDEYQDTNIVQYLWLKILVGNQNDRPQNICCVGDDDQSIYGWRGAEVENILRFERDFKGAKVVRLEENYRSTGHILAAASGVIDHNEERLGKTLFSQNELGHKLEVKSVWDGDEEARIIVEKIEDFKNEGMNLNEIAILVRTSNTMRAFEDRLSIIGIPYRLIGGPKFYERAEIRDVIAYLSVVQNQSNDIKFERIINVPKRGIGTTSVAKIQTFARQSGISLYDAAKKMTAEPPLPATLLKKLKKIVSDLQFGTDKTLAFDRALDDAAYKLKSKDADLVRLFAQQQNQTPLNATLKLLEGEPLSGKAKTEMAKLIENIERWSRLITQMPHVELAKLIFEESGYNQMWRDATTADAPGRLENLEELLGQLGQFPSLGEFLEHITLVMDVEQEEYNSEMVSLMTLHGVKGLEFEAVFLPAWEEGQFPHQRALDESGENGLQEERRLAYVAITRAKKHCFISFAANRLTHGKWQNNLPSRFIDEIPIENAKVEQPNHEYGNYAQNNQSSYFSNQDSYSNNSTFNTPGWQRAQASKKSASISYKPKKRDVIENNFSTGERVYHNKFGYGFVLAIDSARVEVDFDDAGRKKVVASFLEAV